MRKVKYRTENEKPMEHEGLFHQWVTSHNGTPLAIIENEDGTVVCIEHYDMQFIDKF